MKYCLGSKTTKYEKTKTTTKNVLKEMSFLSPTASFLFLHSYLHPPPVAKPTSFVLIYLSSTASSAMLILKTCISSKAIGILGAWFEHNVNVVFAYAWFHTWKNSKWMQGLHLAELSCRRMQNTFQTSTSYHVHFMVWEPIHMYCYSLPSNFISASFYPSPVIHKLQGFWCSFSQENFKVFVFLDGVSFIAVFMYFTTI